MSATNESQTQGYPAWHWILAVLFFIPLIPMLIATLFPQTRTALRPARIWAGYFLFATASFLVLIVLIVVLAPPAEEEATSAVSEKAEPDTQVPQATRQDLANTPVVIPKWTPPSGLGATRKSFQDTFSDELAGGFTLEWMASDTGLEQIMGRSKDGRALLIVVGPASDVIRVSLFMEDSRQVADNNAIYMALLLKHAAPEWTGGLNWVSSAFGDVGQEGRTFTDLDNGKRVTFGKSRSTGLISLGVDAIPAN